MGRRNNSKRVQVHWTMRHYEHVPAYSLCACGKRSFDTEEAALEAGQVLTVIGKAKGKIRVYPCQDKYHYTTMHESTFRKIGGRRNAK